MTENRRFTDNLPDAPLQWDGIPTASEIVVERQQAAINAGAALLKATGTDAAAVLIPGDLAQYVAVGDRAGIAKVLELAAPQAGAGKVEVPRLDDEEIAAIWQSMPGGPANWLKGFGFQQFAKAIEDEVLLNVERAASQPAPVAEKEQSDEWPTPADLLAEDLEKIAETWTGCTYDAPGETIDIGADLRSAFAKLELPARFASPATGEGRQQDERARFEAWYEPKFGKQVRLGDSDQYKLNSTQGAWQAWQARASLSSPSERHEAEELSYAPPADHEALEADADRREQEYFDRWPDRAPASAEPVQAVGLAKQFGYPPILPEPVAAPSSPSERHEAGSDEGEFASFSRARLISYINRLRGALDGPIDPEPEVATPSSHSVEIGTVDTPDLSELIGDVYRAGSHNESCEKSENALIAHIDQHTAQAVKAAREEALELADNAIRGVLWDIENGNGMRDEVYGAERCREAVKAIPRTPQPSVDSKEGEK